MLSEVRQEFFVLHFCKSNLRLKSKVNTINLCYDFSDIWLTKKIVIQNLDKTFKNMGVKAGVRMLNIQDIYINFIYILYYL